MAEVEYSHIVKGIPGRCPLLLEAGTLNAHGIAGLHAALDYLTETGIGTIREKEQALMWEFYEKVRKIPGVIVYGDFSGERTLSHRDA